MTTRDEVLTGGRDLDALLRTLPDKMQRNINRAALRAGAAVFLAEVRQNIPVKSGALRRSARITGRMKNGEVTVSVKIGGNTKKAGDVWYAHLVEYGTRPHVIKPGGVMEINGQFARVVEHPGAAARPYARPAVDVKFSEALAAITAKVRERLTAQGLNVPAPLPPDPEE